MKKNINHPNEHVKFAKDGSTHPFADEKTGLDHFVQEPAFSGSPPDLSSSMPSLYPVPAQLDAEKAINVRPPP